MMLATEFARWVRDSFDELKLTEDQRTAIDSKLEKVYAIQSFDPSPYSAKPGAAPDLRLCRPKTPKLTGGLSYTFRVAQRTSEMIAGIEEPR